MVRLVLIVVFFGLVAGHQDVKHDENGVNSGLGICKGQRTPINKFPYIASLTVRNKLFGAGVILNKWWILTSAFNVKWWQLDDLEFRVGSVQYGDKGQVLKADKVICHDQYSGGWNDNIALVRTSKQMNRKGAKIGSGELPAGTTVKIAGWGSTEPSSAEPSPYLRSTDLNVLDWKQCNETYSPYLTSNMMCTSNEDVGPCSGDFGAPLVYEGSVYGFYSGTNSTNTSPRIYINVNAYKPWIDSIIN